MNKTKIDWATMSWNPVTGCLHGCKYCYARGIAKRFGGRDKMKGKLLPTEWGNIVDLSEPALKDGRKAPFPVKFCPTFHRYRLDEPQRIKKPQNILVCSMADLFGDWVPDEWIKAVFEACEKSPQHRYLFMTKNPKVSEWGFPGGVVAVVCRECFATGPNGKNIHYPDEDEERAIAAWNNRVTEDTDDRRN